ncbi:MAG: hypothetical protein DMG22_09195 [Acidobacteria bacterium]|nr:MAG: hypothetical protein DMG22_09195 [Acidobacteriota bacterium]
MGLALPTLAVIIETLLAAVASQCAGLEGLEDASLRGGWPAFGARVWLLSFYATGLLPFCGLILAIVGKGSPRLAATLGSCLAFVSFLPVLVFSVNSFH